MKGLSVVNTDELILGEERFVSIPGYSRYMISDRGRVINVQTGKEIAEKFSDTKNKDKAYVKLHLYGDNGEDRYLRRNRLVLFSFLGVDYDSYSGMEVDHINGNQHDDRLVNLQLVSPEENKSRKHKRRKALKKPQTEMFFPEPSLKKAA